MTTDKALIYLDNAATTYPKPERVYTAMDQFYRSFGGNAGRGANPLARKASALVEDTRSSLQAWLDVPAVVFAPSATIALNTVIMGARLRAGDCVYVSPFEHNSVLRPLEHLRKTIGFEIKRLPFNAYTFECQLDDVKKLFRLEPPAMLCISQVSNVFGVKLPVDELTALAREVAPQSVVLVDGAQAAGLYSLETNRIDALVWSGHKSLYGPYGIAGIGFGTNWRPEPFVRGGTGTVSESIDMPQNGASRFEAGSQNIVAMAGLNAALEWLHDTGREAINTHTHSLARQLAEELAALPGMVTYMPSNLNMATSIVSFNIEGVQPQAVETALGAENIAVRAGLHCAPWAHRFGKTGSLGGALRVSMSYHNQLSDLVRLVEAMARFVR